jgi:hypothetical protein
MKSPDAETQRAEHLERCKERAMDYWFLGDLANAVASMASDLRKYDDLGCNDYLLRLAMIYVTEHDADGVKRWIEGFR